MGISKVLTEISSINKKKRRLKTLKWNWDILSDANSFKHILIVTNILDSTINVVFMLKLKLFLPFELN